MNRYLVAFAAFLMSLCAGVPSVSADLADKIEKRPLPAGPVLHRAPESANWVITFVYPKALKTENESGPEPSRRLQTLTVTKTKEIYFEVKMYSDGSRRESWHVGNLQISAPAGTRNYNTYEPSSFSESNADPSLYTDYSKTDFPAMGWVSAQNYIGMHTVRDAEYLIFQQSIQSIVPEMGYGVSLLTACIDAHTRLPIWVQSRDAMLSYQFNAAPQARLTLPGEVQQILDKRAKAVKTLTTTVPSF